MPLIAAASPTFTAQPIYIEDVGYAVATWIAPDGSVWPLMDEASGVRTLAEGISGLDAAPITLTRDKQARGGTRVRHVQAEERVITWPLEIWSDESHLEFVQRWRTMLDAITQTTELGPGWLQLARPDGTVRQIACYYQDGFEGKQGLGILADQAVITLLAPDPYWQDTVATSIPRDYATGHPFLAPFPTVSSAHVLGDTVVTNPGEITAWPEWTITGPASGLTATLTSTGASFTLSPGATAHGNLLAGETATIRTNPMQVRGPAGEVWTSAINFPGAVLWGLPRGDSAVTFALTGAGPGSHIELRFYPRYRSA